MPLPCDNGFKVRVMNLLKPLSEKAEITLVCFDKQENLDQHEVSMRRYCNFVGIPLQEDLPSVRPLFQPLPDEMLRTYSKANKKAIAELLAQEDSDVLILEHLKMAPYFIKGFDGVTVLSEHNVETIKYLSFNKIIRGLKLRIWSYLQFLKFMLLEFRVVRSVELCIAVSENDRRLLSAISWPSGNKVKEVPIGVEVTDIEVSQIDEQGEMVLAFSGAMGYKSNIDGIVTFCREVLPDVRKAVPDVRLLIIGRDPPREVRDLESETITVTGTVPDVRDYLKRASLFVCPLRTGGGSKVKIIEAMSVGLPVVTLPEGARGIDAVDGRDIVVARDNADLAAKIVALSADHERRRELGIHAQKRISAKYEYREVGYQYFDLLRMLSDRNKGN